MDQDDRDDREHGNTNTNEEVTPATRQDTNDFTNTQSTKNPNSSEDAIRSEEMTAASGEVPSLYPPEMDTLEMTARGPEVEPATTAYTPDGGATEASTPSRPLAGDSTQIKEATPQSISAPAETTTPAVSSKDKKRFMLIVAASIVLFAIIGVLTWWLLIGNNNDSSSAQADNMLSSSTEQPKLGVALTVIDSTVEYSTDDIEWQTATQDTQLEEGNLVRTGTNSRVVLTLDDGSAVRLDANTRVKLVSLLANNVKIEQIEGSVYSRVVPSDRTYSIAIEDTSYEALGTAFVTVKSESENGVQVYQSAVKVSGSNEEVAEGKQYYTSNNDAAIQGKVTGINIDSLIDNAFVHWNLSQDETDDNFKEKLGVLSQIKERAVARDTEVKAAEEAAKAEAAKILRAKEEARKKEEERAGNKVTRGTMTLGLVGSTFSWNYTGKAVHGYKLVYSKKTATPTLGSNEAIYISDSNETSGELPGKDKISAGKYYVRVCAYTADTESDKCVDYSNVVIINI